MTTNHKILGIIPARAGSKRLPNKNILEFVGKPLTYHIIKSATESKLINTLVVNTDSDFILKMVSNTFQNVIPLKRPQHLAEDKSPAIDYVFHTLDYLKNKFGNEYDIIVILQSTSPLTLPMDIDATIQKLIDSEADSAVSVVKVSHMLNPLKLKVLEEDKLLPYFEEEKNRMAAHQIPTVYVRNCAVYASTIDTIKEGKIIGDDCRAYEMPILRSVDINDEFDFKFAEFLYLQQQ